MATAKTIRCCLAALLALLLGVPAAHAGPLSVVDVGFPATNCVFNPACTLTVTDSIGDIPLGAGGTARLQSRTFTGAAGAPGAGKWGYMYRVDLTQAVGIVNIPCVGALKIDFGPVTKLPYKGAGPPDDVFVGTSGGLGTIGLTSAVQTGSVITFTFSQPVCAGSSPGKGDTSFFFGLASAKGPKAITAKVQVTGGPLVNVAGRAPIH